MNRPLATTDHEHSEVVIQAANWPVDQRPVLQPITPALRQRFDLSPKEACESVALADRYRVLRSAFA